MPYNRLRRARPKQCRRRARLHTGALAQRTDREIRRLLRLHCCARCGEDSLEHIKGLNLHLTGRRRIERNVNDVTRGRRMLLAVDVDVDTLVRGRTK